MPIVNPMNALSENERQQAYNLLNTTWSGVSPEIMSGFRNYWNSSSSPYDAWVNSPYSGLRTKVLNNPEADKYYYDTSTPKGYIGEGSGAPNYGTPDKNMQWAYTFEPGYSGEGVPTPDRWALNPAAKGIFGMEEAGASFLPLSYIERNQDHYRSIDPNFDITKLRTTDHPVMGKVALPQDLPQTDQTTGEMLGEMAGAAGTIAGIASGFGNALGYLQPGSGFNFMGDLFGSLGFGGGGSPFSLGNLFGDNSGYSMGPDAWSFGPGNIGDSVSGWDFGPGTIGDPTLAGDFMRDTMGLNPWDYGPGNIGDINTGWDFGPGNLNDPTISGDFTNDLFSSPEFQNWFSGYADFMSSPAPIPPEFDMSLVPGMQENSAFPSAADYALEGQGYQWDTPTGGTGLDSSGLSQDPRAALQATLDQQVASGQLTPAQARQAMTTFSSTGGASGGIMDRLMRGTMATPLSSIFKLGQSLYAGNANRERAGDMRDLLQEYSGRLDPFGSQRPQYQQRLASLFTPQGQRQSFNEWMQGAGGTLRDQTMARLAASGRRANPGALTSRLHREYMANLGNERNLLSNLSGAQFGPGAVANLATTLGPRTSDAGAYSPLFGALGSIFGSSLGNTSLSDIFG